MAEGSEVNEIHIQNLANLCRICGNRLKKLKQTYQTTYSCKDYKEFLEENFQFNTEKDDVAIHPPRFCNLCYITHTRERVYWEIHTDDGNCSTCTREEKAKKGGRPKKSKRGGGKHAQKNLDDMRTNSSSTQTIKTVLKGKITTLRDSTASIRHPQFTDNFELVEKRKEEFFCPICKDVLDIPIETVCSHYSCADCLFQAIELMDGPPSCPMCKLHLTCESDLRSAPRVFIQLICQVDVRCKRCKRELQYENCLNHNCEPTQVAPPQNPQPTAPAPQRTLEDAFTELQQGKISKDVARLSTAAVKLLMKESDDGGTARLTGPGKPIVLQRVPQAEKPSELVSERHLRRRTSTIKKVGDTVSSGEMDRHIIKLLRRESKEERKRLITEALGTELTLELPEGEALSMKEDVGLSWFRLNKLRRWFKKWGVKMDSEKCQRIQKKELIGETLEAEELPLEHTVKKNNKNVTVIKQTPCAYVRDLNEKVTAYVEDLSETGQLTWHGGQIPESQLYLKLGGDHGQGSMKFEFQLANVLKPNSSKKTVVFAIFEAKDTRNNLRAVTSNYKEQLEDLRQTTWQGKRFLLFLFGDYEFLCKVMGISGASGRHPCLWCTILALQMQLPHDKRSAVQERTLKHLKETLQEFQTRANGDIKKAKDYFNVIHEPLIDIPIDQICVPGLHISLGLFLKFYELLLEECKELDMKIALKKAASSSTLPTTTEFDGYVQKLREAMSHEKTAEHLRAEAQQVQDHLTYLITHCGLELSATNPHPNIQQMIQHGQHLLIRAQEEESVAKQLQEHLHFTRDMGKIHTAMEDQLQEINVKRQAYHSNSFVGNHVTTCLKTQNIQKICHKLVEVTEHECPELVPEAKVTEEKFKKLFCLFGECHFKYNSSSPMDETEANALEHDIQTFAAYFRSKFAKFTFPPKFHMLEDHVVPFIKKWKFPLGFFGEQGGESIHHEFKIFEQTNISVKPASERLKKMLEQHYVVVSPKGRELIPEKGTRALKRKANEVEFRPCDAT